MDDLKFEFRPDLMEVAPGIWVIKNYPIDWYNNIRESLDMHTNEFYIPEIFDQRNIMVVLEHNGSAELDDRLCPDYCGYFSPSEHMRGESAQMLPEGDMKSLYPERIHKRMVAMDLGSETIDCIHSKEYVDRIKSSEFKHYEIAAVDIETLTNPSSQELSPIAVGFVGDSLKKAWVGTRCFDKFFI